MSKRILLLSSHERSFLNFRRTMVQQLAMNGHQVTIAVWGRPSAQHQQLSDFSNHHNVKLRYLGSKGANLSVLNDLWACLYLWFLAMSSGANRALVFAAKPIAIGTIVLALAGVKTTVLMEGKGTGIARGGLIARINTVLYSMAFKLCRHLIVLNPFDRKWAIERTGANPNKISLFDGIGVELDQFKERGTMADAPTLAYIGRLAVSKGVLVLIQAFLKVRQHIPEARLVLVGPSAEAIMDQLQPDDLPEASGVEILGEVPRDSIASIISQSWAIVVPSIAPEGLPMAIQEAFACSRAAIATDVEGARDAIGRSIEEQKATGWVIEPNDVGALAQAITQALGDKERVTAKGQAARLAAERRFDRARIDQDFIGILLA